MFKGRLGGFCNQGGFNDFAKFSLRQLGRSTSNVAIFYRENADFPESADSHAVYQISRYRGCDGRVNANQNASVMEGVMSSTTIITTIKIQTGVRDPAKRTLCEFDKPIGKCVAVIDKLLEENWGDKNGAYSGSSRH